jgi:hypothetical protein
MQRPCLRHAAVHLRDGVRRVLSGAQLWSPALHLANQPPACGASSAQACAAISLDAVPTLRLLGCSGSTSRVQATFALLLFGNAGKCGSN